MRHRKKHRLTTAAITALLLAVIVPMATVALWMFVERWAWPDLWPQVFSTRALREIFGRKEQLLTLFCSSILISVIVGVLSVVIGLLTARALVFYEFPGKKCISFLTILPFMVPATVFAMGIQMTFIKLGINNTVTGVILAHLVCSLPYAVRLLTDGMEGTGLALEEQARVLGAPPLYAFAKVTLPILSPVILSALSMAYIVSFSQYFLTLLIGGGSVRTFMIVMVPYLQGGDRNIACVYSAVFLAVTLAVFGVFEWIAGRAAKHGTGEFYT